MRGVGRKRTKDRHLPQRVYYRRKAYYFVDLNGKWHPLGKVYADALRVLAALVEKAAPANTMEQLIARYSAEELGTKAAKTRRGRLQEFKPILKAFGRMSAESIEPHHVWSFFQARGKTVQAHHEVRALSALLTYARRIGARSKQNPCFGLQLPMPAPRKRYVTDEEFLLVRAVAQPMIGYAMDLALLTGMDEGTIRQLERRHWSDQGFTFERVKTDKSQQVGWSEEVDLTVKAILRERPQLRRSLICNRKGQPYTADGFQSQWQRTMAKALKTGLKERFTFHDLRAKSASDAETDQEAADRLGHGDPRLTRRVYRRLPQRSKPLAFLPKAETEK